MLLFEVANGLLEFLLLRDELAVATPLFVGFVVKLEDLGLGAGQALAGRLQLAPDLLEFEIELWPSQFGQDLVGRNVLSVLGGRSPTTPSVRAKTSAICRGWSSPRASMRKSAGTRHRAMPAAATTASQQSRS